MPKFWASPTKKHKFVDDKKKKNGNQKIEMKFNLEGMENIMGKEENLSIFSFPQNVFKGNNKFKS